MIPHLVSHAVEHLLATQLVPEQPFHPSGQVSRGEKVMSMLVDRKSTLDLQWEKKAGKCRCSSNDKISMSYRGKCDQIHLLFTYGCRPGEQTISEVLENPTKRHILPAVGAPT